MRTAVQVLGGVVLGLGLGALLGLDPGLLFAVYTIGLGGTLLCIGLLLPTEADGPDGRGSPSRPHGR